jgi:restriction endonuclease S subunit
MSVSIVNKSAFGSGFARLDAEYVERNSLACEASIRAKFEGVRLEDIVENEEGQEKENQILLHADSEQVLKYISIDSVDTIDGLAFDTQYSSINDLPSRAQYVVQAKDILVSNVRPNRGAVTIIRQGQAGMIASTGFTLIRLKGKCAYSPEYVFTLLKTPFMRDQLIRRSRGSMYPAVLRSDVLDLFCPLPSREIEQKVISLVAEADVLQTHFFELKRKSADMLTKFLRPIGSPPGPTVSARDGVDWTEVNSSAFFSQNGAQRIDAEFFRQEYAQFDDSCRTKGSSFLLGDYFDLSPGRALKPSAKTTYYAKQGILTNVGINWSALEEADGDLVEGAWAIQENDILLACTAHEIAYIGRKVDLVSAIPDFITGEVACVPDIMILRPKKKASSLSLHYIAAFLRHPAGLHQVQRCIRGLRGGHVYKSDLSRFVRVPLPEKKWMQQFNVIEQEAEDARNGAKRIIQHAIEHVSVMLS